MQHPLNDQWAMYGLFPAPFGSEDYATDSVCKLGQFATVEDFWNLYEHVPGPSQLFAYSDRDGFIRRGSLQDKPLEALGLFRNQVLPMWEDPANCLGGHWEFRASVECDVLDDVWHDLVTAGVGEKLGQTVTGIRVVDKTKQKKRGVVMEQRIEVWLRTCEGKEEVLRNIRLALRQSSAQWNWVFKPHADKV